MRPFTNPSPRPHELANVVKSPPNTRHSFKRDASGLCLTPQQEISDSFLPPCHQIPAGKGNVPVELKHKLGSGSKASYGLSCTTAGLLARGDKCDSASSTAGRSSSDISLSDIPACHVCEVRCEPNMLIKCTSCTRRYHRFCSTKSVPMIIDHSWQCQRCESKKVPLKRSAVTDHHSDSESGRMSFIRPRKRTRVAESLHHASENSKIVASLTHDIGRLDAVSSITSRGVLDEIVKSGKISHHVGGTHPKFQSFNRNSVVPSSSASEDVVHADDLKLIEVYGLAEKINGQADHLISLQYANYSDAPSNPNVFKQDVLEIDATEAPSRDEPNAMHENKRGREEHVAATSSQVERPTKEYPAMSVEPLREKDIQLLDAEREKMPDTGVSVSRSVATKMSAASVASAEHAFCAIDDLETHFEHHGTNTDNSCDTDNPNISLLRATESGLTLADASKPRNQWYEGPNDETSTKKGQENHAQPLHEFHSARDDIDNLHSATRSFESVAKDAEMGIKSHFPLDTSIKTARRRSQRSKALDEKDLGNWSRRPKNTYWRLIGMALCDAPGHRLQPVSVVRWVSETVRGYPLALGSWVENIKSTMILNVTGHCSKVLARRMPWKEGDGGEGKGDWYHLLPGLENELEHWDYRLQRPVYPSGARQYSSSSTGELDAENDEDSCSNVDVPAPATKFVPSFGLKANNHQIKAESLSSDVVEVDDMHQKSRMVTMQLKRPDSRAFAAKLQQESALENVIDPSSVQPLKPNGQQQLPVLKVNKSDLTVVHGELENITRTQIAPHRAYLHQLLARELAQQEGSQKNFHVSWPELHAENLLHTKMKIQEIQARPTRKQLFGTPACRSALGKVDLYAPDIPRKIRIVYPGMHQHEPEDDIVQQVHCASLEEFFSLPGDLIPAVHDRQLAFRHAEKRSRAVFRTAI